MNIDNVRTSTAVLTLEASETSAPSSAPSPPTPGALLPAPVPTLLAGDVSAEIAALAVQTGETQEDIDNTASETDDKIEDQAEAQEVNTMHQEASETRTGAWESGLLQIGAGACTMTSSGLGIGAASDSGRAGAAGILKGVGEAFNGGGTIAGGLSKADATDMEALATASKALADSANRAGQSATDGQKQATDFVQAALDFYKEFQTAKAQADAAAAHGA